MYFLTDYVIKTMGHETISSLGDSSPMSDLCDYIAEFEEKFPKWISKDHEFDDTPCYEVVGICKILHSKIDHYVCPTVSIKIITKYVLNYYLTLVEVIKNDNHLQNLIDILIGYYNKRSINFMVEVFIQDDMFSEILQDTLDHHQIDNNKKINIIREAFFQYQESGKDYTLAFNNSNGLIITELRCTLLMSNGGKIHKKSKINYYHHTFFK